MSSDIYFKSFKEMAELSSIITGTESEKDFFKKLLSAAIKSIPEAECGSIWKINGSLYKGIVGYCYDDSISKIEIPIEESYIYKTLENDEIIEVKDIENAKMKPQELYLDKSNKLAKNVITLIAPLKINKKIVGHIYIDNFLINTFSEESKKILQVFSNFASTFLALKASRDKEREANELNSVYWSFITHELRTPLTSSLGYAEYILRNRDIEEKELRIHVKKIYASSKHMNSLINDISAFNKLNRENKISIEKTAFKQIIFESISIVEPLISPDVELNIKYEKDVPEFIETDTTKFTQVLVNIIGNAIKYTDYGYVDVKVAYDKNKKLFIIQVEDSGPGIPKDKLEDIFKPFIRLSKDKPGSGLGLAIVKKTIKLLGGDLTVVSEVGYGTKFTIKIPHSLKVF